MLYFHILELVDATEVSSAYAVVEPVVLQLRSVFEALLQLEYLVKEDSERRALTWMVCDAHQRIAHLELMDPGTKSGKNLEACRLEDSVFRNIDFTKHTDRAREETAHLNQFFEREEVQPIEEEYQQMWKKKIWPPPYSLFGGPSRLEDLAKLLNRGAQYLALYGFWSRTVHGGGWPRFIAGRDDQGRAQVWPLRNPVEIKNYALMSCHFLLDATRALIGYFRPGENLQSWYSREVEPLLEKLKRLKITVQVLEDST